MHAGQPAQFITMAEEAMPLPKSNKDKPITDNSTVQEVFRVKSPTRLTDERAKDFIHFNKLNLDYPYKFEDPKSLVGLEIEVENVLHINPNIPLGFWEIAEDGSLRNNGREFKTVALPLRYVEYALNQLAAGLNDTVDFSVRTSVHAHQDVRGMTLNQLICLLLTYSTVENLLFKYAGNNRRNSIYCVPLRETDLMSNFTTHTTMIKQLRQINHTWHKYSALNLLPISTFGTVEYRHMPGTLDVKRLLIWLDLISHLKVFAYKVNYDDLSKMVCELNTNSAYLHFVEKVFGNLTEYLDTRSLRDDMEKSVYLVKNACIANEFHTKVVSSALLPDSQLGKKLAPKPLSEFMTPEQEVAFRAYVAIYYPNHTDFASLFKTISKDPKKYLRNTAHPEHRRHLAQALGLRLSDGKKFPGGTILPNPMDQW